MNRQTFGLVPSILFGAAAAALGGSVWAAVAGVGCGACNSLHTALPLAWIGVAFYAVLTAIAGWGKRPAWTQAGFFVAAGTHIVLLSFLLSKQILCPPCIFTGVAALIGALFSLALFRPGKAALVCFVLMGLLSLPLVVTPRSDEPAESESSPQVEAGHVLLIVYERAECYECQMFEAQIVPKLYEDFGTSLVLIRRPAPADMQTPTILIEGKEKRTFTGLPSLADLEQAMKAALGP